MAKQAKLNKNAAAFPSHLNKRLAEGVFILTLSCSIFLLLALLTYHQNDPGWTHASSSARILNAGGLVGAWVADILLLACGYFAYVLPALLLAVAWQVLRERKTWSLNPHSLILRITGLLIAMVGSCGLASFYSTPLAQDKLPATAGGLSGHFIASGLDAAFNPTGTIVILCALLLSGITLCTGLSWLAVIESIGRYSILATKKFASFLVSFIGSVKNSRKPKAKPVKIAIKRQEPSVDKPSDLKSNKPKVNASTQKPKPSKRYVEEKQGKLFKAAQTSQGLPPLSLLDPPETNTAQAYSNQELEDMSRNVEHRLLDFGVEVQVVAVHPGPVITRFELQLAPGIKVSKISALGKDLARSLSMTSVRVVEVIPGKSVIGLELPNKNREMVRLSEVLSTEQYDQAHSPLSLALGVDIAGHPVIVDLAKMPHLLVAGTTGSGKSVGLNAMLLSLLFKSTPDEVRLILVDPKMLELSVYDDIPHLLSPVVTDMKEAANALRWSVAEMERRYRLMASLGVRNLSGYNKKVKQAIEKGEPIPDPLFPSNDQVEDIPSLKPLPYIVVVIDELADMMMVVGKKVEQLIARIAQKARAAGIHLILATQRPSVDVLTGLIKSNIPTRISFQVSSKIDSRTILDQQGAEQLLGHGDMLYLAPGTGAPMRVHGAYIDDSEVHRVAEEWRGRGQPEYIEAVTEGASDLGDFGIPGEESNGTEDTDEFYDEAVYFVTQTRKASISSVQRRFKIGYNRAARLIEEMERAGIVSAMESNGAREVLAPPPPGD